MIQEQIKSKTIQVNGVPVTCHSDGSITCYNLASGNPVRSFGTKKLNGYMHRGINGKKFLVHRLIASAFHGKPRKGENPDHINGNRADNRAENLRWVNQSRNLRGARTTHGASKYRGVSKNTGRWSAQCLGKRYGSFDTELEAAERWDDVAFYEHNFPLEGLNFPQRILDKMTTSDTNKSMTNTPENIERIQTQIEMIRQESRILSYRIDRMMEQRKTLSEEKRKLKDALASYGVK